MADPKRIQLRRTKGWRKPPGAVVVSRPGVWGNPIRLERRDDWEGKWLVTDAQGNVMEHFATRQEAAACAVALFRDWITDPVTGAWWKQNLSKLRGKDLACWCPYGQACHADVLLELANKEPGEGDR